MLAPLLFLSIALALPAHRAPNRLDRLVAMAHLDAAVRYFNPTVATGASSWDSLFAAHVVRIADAPDAKEYRREVMALMADLHDAARSTASPQRALSYNGFPSPTFAGSGGYGLSWRRTDAAESYRVEMGEGVEVEVRTSESSGDLSAPVKPPVAPVSLEWRATYPSPGLRILGAARLWSTIRLFYPYKSLMGGSWDDALRTALPAVERARDSLEYAQAIAAFASHIHDVHVTIGSPALRTFAGAVPVGAAARLIEDKLVITRIADSSAARSGLRVGDVVISVDGESVRTRIARLTPYLVASTPQSLRYRLQSTLLSGANDAPARLVVLGATGGERSITVPRSASYSTPLQKQREGNIIRILPGNIGYIDLDRLPVSMVDSAFRILARTSAIVLDDRGYPLGTAWAIAPRLNTHGSGTVAAKFRRLVVTSPDTARTTVTEFDQPIPPGNGVATYGGRTVMLVDERTISQAEHTGLFFEAANGTTFIGSPTMGANGDVTNFTIPGNIGISFTGHDVRHADGRQLQRVGLQPQVTIMPTIAGIRAGHDEVLEAALRYLGGTGEVPRDSVITTPVIALVPEPPLDGWNVGNTSDYRVGADTSVRHGGASSGHITARTSSPGGFSAFNQGVRPDAYRGKRVRYSAFVKTRNVQGSGAGLWMRVDGNGGVMAFDNMMRRAMTGSTDWTRVSVVLDVPADAAGIAIGFLLASAGEAWVDDASFEIVGSDVPSTSTSTVTSSSEPDRAAQQQAMYARVPLAPVNLGFELRP